MSEGSNDSQFLPGWSGGCQEGRSALSGFWCRRAADTFTSWMKYNLVKVKSREITTMS